MIRRMHCAFALAVVVVATAALTPATVWSQTAETVLRADDLASLVWRELGPAVTSGRITAFAVHPDDTRIVYAASASGGAWKTDNGGTTWRPVFEGGGSVSLGAIALAPSHPDIIWLGTGEQNSVRSSSFGDGVYRSDDGGASWRHMGLEVSRHIGRIVIHPDNPDIVFVAAMGSLWGPGPERGLYRTTDGGAHWERVLEIGEYTGVVEVRMDPRVPDVLLAAAFQRERRQWSMVGGGPESGLFRSVDGGDSWTRVAGGFPTGEVGRIGIAYCPGSPDTVYASAVGPDGGIFRSDDAGRSWERRNSEIQSHWYYGELVCDPTNADRLYVPMTPLYVSDDGGRTFRNLVEGAVHVDHHTLWVDPSDPEHLILGNDGGIYISRDRGQHFAWQSNVPVMQLYTVAVDMQEPFYHVYGGAQDNGSWGGPVGSRFSSGVTNDDWIHTAGGDGFHSQVDPLDPDIVYAESQYGVLYRMDRATGERRRIQPWSGESAPYRWNWSAPLVLSPHDPATLYFAANVVFRSRDRGDSWQVVSPDLTRGLSRDSLPLQGRIQPADAIDLHASTALYGNVSTLSVSSLRPGLVAAGTDDGLVQVTRDDGQSWHRSARFPGVPERTKASTVAWSSTREGTLFAAFDGHKDDVYRPLVVRSDDYGVTWRDISGNLPEFGPVRSVAVHPRNGDLVFVGTEFGVFFSNRGGDRWLRLGSGLPVVAVHAMVVHPRDNDLVLGTHGRGFWVLDDVGLLEALTPEVVAEQHSVSAAPRRATRIRDADRGRGSAGDSYWAAANPPRGAIVDFWIGDAAVGEPVSLEVVDDAGAVVRRLFEEPSVARGPRRVVWDLRHEAPLAANSRPSSRGRGRFVLPGSYRVRLRVGDRQHERLLTVVTDPALEVAREELLAHDRLVALQARMVGAVAVAGAVIDTLIAQMETVREAVAASGSAGSALSAQALALGERAQAIRVRLDGLGQGGIAQQETALPLSTLVRQLYSSTESWSGRPTRDQSRITEGALTDLRTLLSGLRILLDDDLPRLRQALTEATLVWPAGDAPVLVNDLLPPP